MVSGPRHVPLIPTAGHQDMSTGVGGEKGPTSLCLPDLTPLGGRLKQAWGWRGDRPVGP